MSQIFEALRKAEALESTRRASSAEMSVVERRRSGRRSIAAQIRIYGHTQGSGTFFEENPIINASGTGALLLMKSPVVAGQKLLLINEAGERVQECRVVRTSSCASQQLEVAVEFANPQPGFWARLGEPTETLEEKRKSPRIVLPRGMNVTWQGPRGAAEAKVRTISVGGLSILTHNPAPAGEIIHLSFAVPAGLILAKALVRHSRGAEGMGVEFTAMSNEARARLVHLLEKLLG
jgi:hypothetical protein